MSLDEASLDVTEHLKASMQGGDEDDVVEVDAWSCSELMLKRAEELSVQIRKEVTECVGTQPHCLFWLIEDTGKRS